MQILVVSTDYDTRLILVTALHCEGYRVRELAEPERVVEAALGCDLVITDYPTPAGNGTVTAQLRGDPRTRKIKILNATTHAFPHELEAAEAAGVDASVTLPALPACIVAQVGRLLTDDLHDRLAKDCDQPE